MFGHENKAENEHATELGLRVIESGVWNYPTLIRGGLRLQVFLRDLNILIARNVKVGGTINTKLS